MNKIWKIATVVALISIVSVVIIAKQNDDSNISESSNSGSMNTAAPSSANESPEALAVENNKTLPHLIDLGADKCIPCKMMKPILDDLKQTYSNNFKVTFIDVWENPDQAEKYNITLIPTQIFYSDSGKELFRHEGFYSKEDILAKWKELGITF